MITIYSQDHHYQNATSELIDGKLMPPVENPKRVDMVLNQVRQVGLGEVLEAEDFGLEPILRIHDRDFVSFLQSAWDTWLIEHGDYDALPLSWATRTMRHDRIPESIDGKLSYYSFDAGTPITKGTWKAAIASAQVALTGQAQLQKGETSAFALCRPPGHHAASNFYGGYCFFNNAAIAAQALLDAGADRIAILDVDYHHGNGTQSIFYDRSDVFFISLHADPRQEYPFFLGYADEIGHGAGERYNQNYPLPWGTNWQSYETALTDALDRIRNYNPDSVIISLGVDTFEQDPISKFLFKIDDYLQLGRAIASIRKPTLFVMEGGYAVEEIGINAVNVLMGFQDSF